MKALIQIIDDLPNSLKQAKLQFNQILKSNEGPNSSLSQFQSLLMSVNIPKSTFNLSSIFSSNLALLTNKETSILFMQLFMVLSKSLYATELTQIVEENKVTEMIINEIETRINFKDSIPSQGSLFASLDYSTILGCYFEFLEFLNKFTCIELKYSVEKSLISLIYLENNDLNLQSKFFYSYTKGLRFMKLCNNYYRSMKVCGEIIGENSQKLSQSFFKLIKFLVYKVNKRSSISFIDKKFNCVKSSKIIGIEYLVTLFYNSQEPLYKKTKNLIFLFFIYFSPKANQNINIIIIHLMSIFFKSFDNSIKIHRKRLVNIIKSLIFRYKFKRAKKHENAIEVCGIFQEESKSIKVYPNTQVSNLQLILAQTFKLHNKALVIEVDGKKYIPQKYFKAINLTSESILSVKIHEGLICTELLTIIPLLVQYCEIFWALFDITANEEISKTILIIAKLLSFKRNLHDSIVNYDICTDSLNLSPKWIHFEFVFSVSYISDKKNWLQKIGELGFNNSILEFLIGFLEKKPNFNMIREVVELISNFTYFETFNNELFFKVTRALLFWILEHPQIIPDSENQNLLEDGYRKIIRKKLILGKQEFFEQAFKNIIGKLKPTEYKQLFDLLRENIDSIAQYLINASQLKYFILPLKKIGEEDAQLLTLILLKFEEIFSTSDLNQVKHIITLLNELNHCPKVIISKLSSILLSFKPEESESHYSEILTFLLKFTDFKLTISEFKKFLTNYLIPEPSNQNSNLPLLKDSKSRTLGFNFVYYQCKSDEDKIHVFFETLSNLLLNKTWRRSKENYWKIKPNHLNTDFEYKGLDNPGTICYSNSFIQQLFHMPTFIDPLLSLYTKEKNCLSALQKVIVKLKFSSQSSVSSNGLIKSCIGPKGLYEQMDTDEFISKLFEKCSKSELGYEFDEIVQKNFIGIQNLEIKCKRCERVCNKTQDFKNIGLQIFKKEKNNLLNSLKKMTCGEVMTGKNALFCASCKRKEDSVMKMSFIELPLYLICVVKRFEYDTNIMAKVKINETFEFTEKINLMEFVKCKASECNRKDFEYQLKGVINHIGTADQGHYISCVRTSKNEWALFNDSDVSIISLNKVLEISFGKPQGDYYTYSSYIIIYKKIEFPQKFSTSRIGKFNLTPCENLFFSKIVEKNKEVKFREILFAEGFINSLLKFINFKEIQIFIVNYTLSCFFRMKLKNPEKMAYYRKIYDQLNLEAVIYLVEILSSQIGVKEFILCNPFPEHKTFLLTLIEKHISSFEKNFLLLTFKRLLIIFANLSFSIYKCNVHLNQLFFLIINYLEEDWKNRYIETIHPQFLDYKQIRLNYELEPYKNDLFWTENYNFVEEVKELNKYHERCPYMFFKFMVDNFNKLGSKLLEQIKRETFIKNAIEIYKNKLGAIAISQLYSEVFKNDTKGGLDYLGYIIGSYSKYPDERILKLISLFFKYYEARTEVFLNFIEFYLDIFVNTQGEENNLFILYTIKSLKKIKYKDIAPILSEESNEKLKNAIEIYLCIKENKALRKISNDFFRGVENKDLDNDEEIDPKIFAMKKAFWVIYYEEFREFEVEHNFCNKILSFAKNGQSVLILDYIHFDRIRIYEV